MFRVLYPLTALCCAGGLVAVLPACSGGDTPSTPPVFGAGAPSQGGSNNGTGGASNESGGTLGSGGTSSGGASVVSGGTTNSGGSSTSGGASSGGASPTSGGAATSGGASMGGVVGSGGAGKGGSASSGGATSGGASPAGGASSGGAASGGAGKGGAATSGGASSGGANSGGAAMGGASTGGVAGGGGAGCTTACLVHRYEFAGSGTNASDSIGTAHATVMNASMSAGTVVLAGGTTDQYVNLPPAVLAGLTSATFEVWVTWTGGAAWQRIFDFGSNDGATAGAQGSGETYLFLSPKAVNNSGKLRVAYSISGNSAETLIDAPAALATGSMVHLAVVVDATAGTLSLYQNGASVGSTALANALSSITATNAWLGRSQYSADPEFAGTIHEFRIYGGARSSAQIQASHAAGPDTAPAN